MSEIRVSEIRVREISVSEIRISSNHHELHGAIFSSKTALRFCREQSRESRISANQSLSARAFDRARTCTWVLSQRGFYVRDVDVNCRLQLQLFFTLTANFF